jgi:transmembrane sensor
MTTRSPQSPRAAAAAHFARRRSGEMTEAQAEAMREWLDASVENAQAVLLADAAWQTAGALIDTPAVACLRRDARRASRVGLFRRAGLGIAAGLALVAAGLLALQVSPSWPAASSREFRTAVGERATVTLADGTLIQLNTNTVVRTRESLRRRAVDLVRGEAYFQVANNPGRPFVVSSVGKTVTALGTAFSVRAESHCLTVTLLEGRVQVAARSGWAGQGFSTDLQPRVRLTARDGEPWSIVPVDGEAELSWRHGKLVFSDIPLRDIVGELNRYSLKKIVIVAPVVGESRLSGSFNLGDIDGAVRAIVRYGLAKVDYQTPDRVALGSPSAEVPRRHTRPGVGERSPTKAPLSSQRPPGKPTA